MEFKMGKVVVIMGGIVRKNVRKSLNQSFHQLLDFTLQLKFKETKVAKHSNFLLKAKLFRTWFSHYKKLQF